MKLQFGAWADGLTENNQWNCPQSLCFVRYGAEHSVFVRGNWQRKRAMPPVQKTLDDLDVEYILAYVFTFPTRTLKEVVGEISSVVGASVSPSTVCRLLRDHNLSHTTVSRLALQRQEDVRAQFWLKLRLLSQPTILSSWMNVGETKKRSTESAVIPSVECAQRRAAFFIVGKDGLHLWHSAALDWLVPSSFKDLPIQRVSLTSSVRKSCPSCSLFLAHIQFWCWTTGVDTWLQSVLI